MCSSAILARIDASMGRSQSQKARLPPRWFVRLFWVCHRRLYRWSGGRLGLWRPKVGGWGAMRINALGRRTGRARSVIVGYFEDGPNIVTLAMNGWGAPDPSWWLNVQAHPDVTVDLPDGSREMRGRAAQGAERERLWARWREIDENLEAYAARRPKRTEVVIFEPAAASRLGSEHGDRIASAARDNP